MELASISYAIAFITGFIFGYIAGLRAVRKVGK